MNAVERTALLRFSSGAVENVSLLDLDTQGLSDSLADAHESDGFGICLGDVVLIHRENNSNGAGSLKVPVIGQLEHWVRDLAPDSQHSETRQEFGRIGMQDFGTLDLGSSDFDMKQGGEVSDPPSWIGEATKVPFLYAS